MEKLMLDISCEFIVQYSNELLKWILSLIYNSSKKKKKK